ncbi:hypothetical protein BGZ47_002716 [Haplosporangium gracile]|nr:hypothetical protein BGZ47_002716 [Haplosporangium gracile]
MTELNKKKADPEKGYHQKLHHDWFYTILPILQKSSHASLKQRANELATAWSDDRNSQEVCDFWDAMKLQDASKNHLKVLHQQLHVRENAVALEHTNTLLAQIGSDMLLIMLFRTFLGKSTSSRKRLTGGPAGSEHKSCKGYNGSLYTASAPSSAPPSARASLNPNDFQYVDHLVGPGQSSSKIQGEPFVVNGINVSKLCIRARKEVIKNQCELNGVSEIRYLNFVFDNSALSRLPPRAAADRILRVSLPVPSQQQSIMLVNTASYAAKHSVQESKRHVTELDDNGNNLVVVALLQDLNVVDHCRDALPTPRGFEEVYQADYFAECEGFSVCVVEIMKPDAKDDPLEGDARKLPNMLKLSLDRLLDAGVESPAIGLLVED